MKRSDRERQRAIRNRISGAPLGKLRRERSSRAGGSGVCRRCPRDSFSLDIGHEHKRPHNHRTTIERIRPQEGCQSQIEGCLIRLHHLSQSVPPTLTLPDKRSSSFVSIGSTRVRATEAAFPLHLGAVQDQAELGNRTVDVTPCHIHSQSWTTSQGREGIQGQNMPSDIIRPGLAFSARNRIAAKCQPIGWRVEAGAHNTPGADATPARQVPNNQSNRAHPTTGRPAKSNQRALVRLQNVNRSVGAPIPRRVTTKDSKYTNRSRARWSTLHFRVFRALRGSPHRSRKCQPIGWRAGDVSGGLLSGVPSGVILLVASDRAGLRCSLLLAEIVFLSPTGRYHP